MTDKWPKVALGECCEIISGATPKTGVEEYWDGDISWATPKDLSVLPGVYLESTERSITPSGLRSCAARILPPGSVLLSSRAPIGHVAINRIPVATNQGFKSLVPSGAIDAKYLYYWLRTNRALLESLGNGATFKEVSKGVVASVELPLPPLEEQRWIADVLDRVDALRAKRASVGHNSRLLPQSVFVQMFGSPSEIPDRWPLRPLDHLVSEFRYGTSIKSGETGYPTLRIPNIVAGSVDANDLKLVDVSVAELGRLRLVDGDLLFVRTNGNPDYVGRCAVFDSAEMSRQGVFGADVIYASYLIRARVNLDLVHPVYVREYLNGPIGRSSMRERSKTSAGQYNVNTAGLGSIPIPVPPLDRQQRFVESVTGVERTWGVQRRALGELDALFASLQHRAFRGEL